MLNNKSHKVIAQRKATQWKLNDIYMINKIKCQTFINKWNWDFQAKQRWRNFKAAWIVANTQYLSSYCDDDTLIHGQKNATWFFKVFPMSLSDYKL